jgi:hypothetical protein
MGVNRCENKGIVNPENCSEASGLTVGHQKQWLPSHTSHGDTPSGVHIFQPWGGAAAPIQRRNLWVCTI